jgi:hypothetical protein
MLLRRRTFFTRAPGSPCWQRPRLHSCRRDIRGRPIGPLTSHRATVGRANDFFHLLVFTHFTDLLFHSLDHPPFPPPPDLLQKNVKNVVGRANDFFSHLP